MKSASRPTQGGASRLCMVAWLLLLLPFGLSAATNAHLEYTARLWQMEDGLPHTIVQAITQTRDGYLWIGTREGLARFDGLAFLSFTARDFGTGLVQPSIVCLCETRDGSLWIGTENVGLFCLHNGRLTRFGSAEGLKGEKVDGLQETWDGTLWIGSSGGLGRLVPGKLEYPFEREMRGWVSALALDDEGVLWMIGSSGVRQLRGQELTPYRPPSGRFPGIPRCLVRDRNGVVWAGDTGGMVRVKDGAVTYYPKGEGVAGIVGAIFTDQGGNLWVGAYSGLSRFLDGKFIAENDERWTPDRVFSIFQDREGNVWVGSEGGLVRLTPRQITTYTKQQGLTADSIAAVCASRDGSVWVSAWGGRAQSLCGRRLYPLWQDQWPGQRFHPRNS